MDITSRDRMHRASMSMGGRINLSLVESPSTGFCWQPEPAPGLEVVDDGFTEDPMSGADEYGADGVRRFTVRGRRPGRFMLSFSHRRPWSGQEVGRAAVEVEVTEG